MASIPPASRDPEPSEVNISTTSKSTLKETKSPSMLYTMLPTVLQSRIPKLASLRQSVSEYRGRPNHTRAESFGSVTPPPSYSSRPGSCTPAFSRLSGLATPDLEDIDLQDESSVYERPSSSDSQVPQFTLNEAESGVNWKYANQGLSLITHSYQESAPLSREHDHGLPPFSRQLYIHGVTYLLRGLPADMTPEEVLSVQAAIPPNVIDLQDCKHNALVPLLNNRARISNDYPSEEPSILHRITATVVVQAFILVQLLLPYMKLFIAHAYRFERKHRVTQRVFAQSVHTMDEVSRRTLQFTSMVCNMNDGKVGQAINDMTIWWVRGVTGGLHQGLSEGIIVLGADGYPRGQERLD